MEPWLIQVGKQKAAAGLTWVALNEDEGASPIADLKEQAKASGRTHAAYYPNEGGRYRLAGFVPERGGRKYEGAIPVAAWLAEVVTKKTIYIEATDDSATRWWIVIVNRPGAIDTNGDVILSDDDTVRILDGILGDAIIERGEGAGVELIVGRGRMVPQSAMIDRAEKRYASIAEVLAESAAPACKVKQVVGIPRVFWISLAGVIAAGGVAAGGYYILNHTQALQSEAAREAEAAARAAEEARLRAIAEQRIGEAVREATLNEQNLPTMAEVVGHCEKAASTVPTSLGGWSLTNFKCDPAADHIEASYQRNAGAKGGLSTRLGLENAVGSKGFTLKTSDPLQDSATVSIPKDPLQPGESQDAQEIEPYQAFQSELVTAVQIVQSTIPGVQIQLAPPSQHPILYIDPTLPDTAAPTQAVPAEKGFLKGQITFNGTDLWRLRASAIHRHNIKGGPIVFNVSGMSLQWTMQTTFITRN